MSIRVVGAGGVLPRGRNELPFRFNYLLGRKSEWKVGVEAFGEVLYSDILPGVDWVFYAGAKRQLEYDFVVSPGASAASIGLVFDGAAAKSIDSKGVLRLSLPNGAVIEQPPPIAYQRDALGRRTLIAARYALKADGSVGFAIGDYDHGREFVIDPTLVYSTYFGGSGFEDARAVGTDSSGNVYVAGSTSLGLFPITTALQPAYGGGSTDAFVCKLNPSGSAILYATFIGGADADVATGLAVDAAGSVYVVGNTLSNDFPTLAPSQAARGGSLDGFFAKLSSAGNSLIYSSYLGGGGDDLPSGVAVDASGSMKIVGSTFSTNFPTVAPFQPTLAGEGDAFVSFVQPSGAALTFSSYLGGLGNDVGAGIALTPAGEAYVVGATSSNNFPTVVAFQPTFAGGGFDAFVAKLSPSGSVSYSSYLGGSGRDEAAGVAVKSSGGALVAGYSLSNNFPGTTAGLQPARAGGADAFLSELSPLGDGIAYSTYLGGTGNDQAQGVAVDSAGNIELVGFTNSTNFPTMSPAQLASGGGNDAFVTQITAGRVTYSSYFGGAGTDKAMAVSVGAVTKTFAVVGNTTSTNFPTLSPLYPTRQGSQDAFVQLFSTQLVAVPFGSWAAAALLAVLLTLARLVQSRKEPNRHVSVS